MCENGAGDRKPVFRKIQSGDGTGFPRSSASFRPTFGCIRTKVIGDEKSYNFLIIFSAANFASDSEA
jgi:hypothetical protein